MVIASPAVVHPKSLDRKPLQWRARIRLARRLASFLAAGVALLAGAVLSLGWGLDIESMRRLLPGQSGMAVTTAAGLLGSAVILISRAVPRLHRAFVIRKLLPVLLLAVALLDLLLLALSPGRGLDQLLFRFSGARAEVYMSPATAACLAIAAVCFLVAPRRARARTSDLFGVLLAAGLTVTTFALAGFLFDSATLKEVFVFAAMSPQTAASFFIIYLALAAAHPTVGWIGLVLGPGPGGETLRRILPFAALGPFVLCWITLRAVEAEIFDVNFRLSTLAISGAGGLIALVFWSAVRENADWKAIEASNRQLQQALAERNLLLREVYHRVKNNLQFVDAMLALEGTSGSADSDRLARIRRRVHALSLVHQQLMSAQDLATLSLRSFLEELCGNLAQGGGLDAQGIRVETDIAAERIDLDRAIPIGLVVTELVSNAAKHAFPAGRGGTISVTGRLSKDGRLRLAVADDGVGQDAGEAAGSSKMGTMILRSLVTQLRADIDTETENGFRVTLTIPLNQM